MSLMISFRKHNLLIKLFCVYAFLIPFEHLLQVFLGIDTVLKPYRLIAIIIIITFFFFYPRIRKSASHVSDIWIYILFAYGVLLSFFVMMFGQFDLGRFLNDFIQIFLYLGVFFVVHQMKINNEEGFLLLSWLVAGITINSFYVGYKYFVLGDLSRQSGFMDNPNYFSLSISVAIIYILTKFREGGIGRYSLFFIGLTFYLLFVFLVAGSRAGLVALIMCLLLSFYFLNFGQKLLIIGMIICAPFFLLLSNVEMNLDSGIVLFNRLEQMDASEDPRITLWNGAIKAASQTYFAGVGIGQFKARFAEFVDHNENETVRDVINQGGFLSTHSDYFGILANYGLIGLISYLIFLFLSFIRLNLKIFNAKNSRAKIILQYNLILLLSIIIFGIAAEEFLSPLYWFLIALVTR